MSTPEPSARRRTDQRYQASEPSRFLGRDEECRAVDELIARVREGLSGVLVISGEAGIGKTRLLMYAAEAAGDLQTARVAGVETESQLAYAALHRLLLPFLDRLDRLPDPQREALGSAFGLLAAPPADRFLAGLATLTLLSEVVLDGPLMCFVDDVQWLDRESLEVLAFVGRRLHADGVGLVLCARDREPGRTSPTPIDGLPALGLTGLSDADAARLLASVPVASSAAQLALRNDSVVSRIIAEAAGNPLALNEFAADLTGGAVPPTPLPLGPRLEAHFQRQVDALPQETKSLLLLLSVAPSDDPVVLWLAAGTLGLSAQALDPAVANRILTTHPHPGFRHPLIRSAVHSGAAPGELRRAHQALAEATDREAAPDRRAWHLAEAVVGLDEDVAAELERVAERARSRGGYAAQAIFLIRAAELTPDPRARAERYFTAAQAHLVIGDTAMAQSVLDQSVLGQSALDRSEADPGTPTARATAQRLRAAIEWLRGRAAMAPSILMPAAADVLAVDQRVARDMVFEALAAGMMTRDRTVGMTLEELARQILAMPWNRAAPTLPDLVMDAYCTRIAEGYAAAVPKLRASVRALLTGDLVETGMPIALMAYVGAEDLWDDRGYGAVMARLATVARAQGALQSLGVVLYALAASELWAGRFVGAQSCYDEADELALALGTVPKGPSHRVELLAWQGRRAELLVGTDDALTRWGGQLGFAVMAGNAHHALTILELGAGNYSEALTWARLGYENDVPGQGNLLLPDVIEAAVRAGDPATASAALARLTERAPLSGTPWALGLLARSRALMADDEHAEGFYEEAVKHLADTVVVTDQARTHLLFGEWLSSVGRRAEARAQLRKSYEMFTDMGAAGFADRARNGLLALGEQARTRGARADVDLTPQEKQVAALAAGGLTNTEIATRLFITTSTVEYHLNKVFRKLGITSRRQLSEVLGGAVGAA
ncbi:DNA-binding CsgD family transcriptional regulator [Catenulispora sp. GP43]|uniref:helix-turn-helix transcriptional regulator n=1 Tax=Catenulispora sp. GP43 TaxID=3156263 RepID=UPI0035116746